MKALLELTLKVIDDEGYLAEPGRVEYKADQVFARIGVTFKDIQEGYLTYWKAYKALDGFPDEAYQ